MAIKTIITEPNKILRQKSLPVNKIEKEEQRLMDDMLETMYDAKGIGLAAIQIGVPKRIIVMDISKNDKESNPMYFVNPIIKNKISETSTYEEGCLSVPNFFAEVERPKKCEVEYQDYNGEKKILKAEGLLATCIQHEMDHLEGILFIDHLSKLKKTMIVKKLSKKKDRPDKIVFMGTSNFAVPILKSLYQNGYPIAAVYTQPPKKSNRGQKLNKSPINLFSENISLEVRTPLTLKSNNHEELYLSKLEPDLIVVVSYGQIIPKNMLMIPKYGFLNVHASLLPKWRGAAPIQRSIMNLDTETGISMMKINENLDEGPVYDQYSIKISENMNSEELSEKLSLLASEKILDVLDKVYDDNIKFNYQDHSKATYAKKIKKIEGKINWNESADKIIGKINGLYPFPGAFFLFNGERFKILKAEKSYTKGEPGMVIGEDLEICCKDGSIKVLVIQREGKRVQQINEFLLGMQIKKGFNIA